MASNLKKFKDYVTNITTKSNSATNLNEINPEIGFKIAYSVSDKQIKVKIISARNLTLYYGSNKAKGFLTKVTLFPGKEKYETQILKDSNPNFNQEFCFKLETPLNKVDDIFKGKFLVLTVYAILEVDDNKKTTKLKRTASLRNSIQTFLNGKDDNDQELTLRRGTTDSKRRSLNRISFNNRRTIGAVTYNLEMKYFNLKLKNHCLSTPDIWRPIQTISCGIQVESKESKNGCLEITMIYSNSEDGNNESIGISISKFRCSMKTMQQHEKYGGSLYLKIKVYEQDKLISTWKSDKFEPTISMKIESNTATLNAIFKRENIDNIKIVFRLLCKNMLGKKHLLGKIDISNETNMWKRIIETPSVNVTEMVNFD